MKAILLFLSLIFLCLNVQAQGTDIPTLIESNLSSVVLVQTDSALGSGVIISVNGYILTNYHVVQNAVEQNSSITITTHNKDLYYAELIDFDEDLDVCLLKTPFLENSTDFPVANPDSIKVGEDVVCIGNPFGILEYVTKGIISKYTTPYIFTAASINPGNSGGALINLKGELVGIPSMQLEDSQNFNIALCPRTIIYFLNKNKINYRKR